MTREVDSRQVSMEEERTRGTYGHLGATRMILHVLVALIFPITVGTRCMGGKAYPLMCSHDMVSESTPTARGSGTGLTNSGSLLFNLVANRSTWGCLYAKEGREKNRDMKLLVFQFHMYDSVWYLPPLLEQLEEGFPL